MGKDEKEDTGFGFKDRAKAEETLRLLEQHEPGYRRLTVRGLLGRAKRTLSLTKAEEKKKNIKEAMEVFEGWLADLDSQKTDKADNKHKTEKEDRQSKDDKDTSPDTDMKDLSLKTLPSDKVPNLGFKDKQAAEATLKELEGRDPEYQRLAVKGLIGSANRVLTCTKDETKLSNIKEAIGILEKFLDEYDSKHLSRQNNAYLSVGIVAAAREMAGDDASQEQIAFASAYESVDGEYKRLRTVKPAGGDKTWDIVRNTALAVLKEKNANAKLFDDSNKPTKEHLQMLLWAYSPDPARVKKLIPESKQEKRQQEAPAEEKSERSSRKRKSSHTDEDTANKKQKD